MTPSKEERWKTAVAEYATKADRREAAWDEFRLVMGPLKVEYERARDAAVAELRHKLRAIEAVGEGK